MCPVGRTLEPLAHTSRICKMISPVTNVLAPPRPVLAPPSLVLALALWEGVGRADSGGWTARSGLRIAGSFCSRTQGRLCPLLAHSSFGTPFSFLFFFFF